MTQQASPIAPVRFLPSTFGPTHTRLRSSFQTSNARAHIGKASRDRVRRIPTRAGFTQDVFQARDIAVTVSEAERTLSNSDGSEANPSSGELLATNGLLREAARCFTQRRRHESP